MKRYRIREALAASIVLALAATACVKATAPAASPTAAPLPVCTAPPGCVTVPAGAPIEIGTLLSTSGSNSALGLDSQRGIELAVDYLDGKFDGVAGTIDDHAVRLVDANDGCSADSGSAGANSLAADPQVVGVIGTSCSVSSLGVADKILSAKGITTISPSAISPALTAAGTHQSYWFRTAYNDRIQAAVVSDYATQKLGAKTAVTIHDESPDTQGLTDAFKTDFEASGGTVTGELTIKSTDTDFKGLFTTLVQHPPDVIYAPSFNPACALIVKQKAAIGGLSKVATMTSDGCADPTFSTIAGASGDGVYFSEPDLSSISSGDFYKGQFLPAYEREFGTQPVSLFHAQAFDAFDILAKAIKTSAVENDDGSLTIPRVSVRDAVEATHGYPGVSGTITCTSLGDCATSLTVGIYIYPNVPFVNPAAKPVFSETKTLAEVG